MSRRLPLGRGALSAKLSASVLGLVLCHPALGDPPKSGPEMEAAIQRAMDLSLVFQKVAADASPAVVNITANRQAMSSIDDDADAMFRRFFGQRAPMQRQPQVVQSFGSGVIVSKDGYIITNNHVVEGSTLVTVKLGDNASYTARIIGTDPATDVAVLKIEGESLPFVTLGDSDKTNVGEWVLAVGNPFGLDQTVTAGIISAKGRTQRAGGLQEVQYQDFIQTDASINPGNSGGPLLNLRGQVIGINSAILSRAGGSVGIGFAIPSNLAKSVMESVVSNNGEVRRSWLGVIMRDLNAEVSRSVGYQGTSGVLVSDVAPKSPAQNAGLKPGDIITKFDGRAVQDRLALQNLVGVTVPGKTVDVELFREGRSIKKAVAVQQRAAPAEIVKSLSKEGGLGIEGQSVTAEIAERLQDTEAKGVVVTKVERGSPAEMVGITPGLVITAINRKPVRDAAEFREAMERADFVRGVQIVVRRNGAEQTAFIRMGR